MTLLTALSSGFPCSTINFTQDVTQLALGVLPRDIYLHSP